MEASVRQEEMEARIEYLEGVCRSTIEALEMAASLGDLQGSLRDLRVSSSILRETAERVKKIIPFQATAFYLVEEESSDLFLKHGEPADALESLQKEVDFFIQNGTCAWAMREKGAVEVASKDLKQKILLHVLATRARIRGLFVGILPPGEKNIPEVSLAVLSLILSNTANALENVELCVMFQKARETMEGRVQDRTEELMKLNEQLTQEVGERKQTEEALKEIGERYCIITGNMIDTVWMMDMDLNLTFVSPSAERARGYTVEELKGSPLEKHITPSSLVIALKAVLHDLTQARVGVKDGGKAKTLELEFYRKDGSTYWSEVKISLLQNAQGLPTGILGVGRDVTERRRVQEELKKSEETATRLAREAEMIAEIGRIISSTLRMEEVYERLAAAVRKMIPFDRLSVKLMTPDRKDITIPYLAGLEVEGRRVGDVLPLAGSVVEQLSGAHAGLLIQPEPGEELETRFFFLGPNFRAGIRSVLAVPLISRDQIFGSLLVQAKKEKAYTPPDLHLAERIADQIAGAIANAALFLECRRADEALRESEEKFRVLFNSVEDFIYIKDSNLRYILVNNFFLKRFSISSSTFLGKTDGEIGHYADPAKVQAITAGHDLRTLKGETLEYEIALPIQGREVQFHVIQTPLRNGNGRISGICAIARDVTERRKLEDELLKIRKLESISTLAGGIAHDFNNMLTIILGNLSLAKLQVKADNKIFGLLDDAEKTSIRAGELTKQLIALAQGGEPVKKVVFLGELLTNASHLALSGSNIRCELNVPNNLWPVVVDEGQMGQVIQHMVFNAREAMSEGGMIYIRAENSVMRAKEGLPLKEGDYVKISIEDQGVGIPEENLSKIFDPYFTTKEKGPQKGMGLGLSICFSIIKNHGGFIQVESKVGVGTTFHIYFLAAKDKLPPKREKTPKTYIVRGKVLFMDDVESIRNVTGEMLKQIGYEVECVKDGAEALDAYRKAKEAKKAFDVVILDLTVQGGIGGKEAIKKLLEIDPKVKAVVSSGYLNDPIILEYREYGFKDAITKPFRIEKLRATISQVIGLSS